jgi:hypothetical protein
MEIQITSTDQLTTIDGVPVRLWEGVTADGVRCKVFVHRLAVHNNDDVSQFAAELNEQLPPGRHVPLSMIL